MQYLRCNKIYKMARKKKKSFNQLMKLKLLIGEPEKEEKLIH